MKHLSVVIESWLNCWIKWDQLCSTKLGVSEGIVHFVHFGFTKRRNKKRSTCVALRIGMDMLYLSL